VAATAYNTQGIRADDQVKRALEELPGLLPSGVGKADLQVDTRDGNAGNPKPSEAMAKRIVTFVRE